MLIPHFAKGKANLQGPCCLQPCVATPMTHNTNTISLLYYIFSQAKLCIKKDISFISPPTTTSYNTIQNPRNVSLDNLNTHASKG